MGSCNQRDTRSPCFPGRCRISAEEYLRIIESALPRGVLWMLDNERNYSKFWMAIAELLSWFQGAVCAALDEFFPCYSDELLSRHADIWGYPVECMGYPENADQLCKWITLVGSPCFGNNLWTIKALIEFSGIDFVERVEEVIPEPFVVGCSTVCEPLGPTQSAGGCFANCCKLVITLNDAFFDTCKPFRVGECCGSAVCDKLGAYDKRGLDCIIGRYFTNAVPVYISDSAGTRSILLTPPDTCF